jgi:methyl-accepting chemotaxis protein
MRVKKTLPNLMADYMKDLEADEKDRLSSDIVETWKEAALDLARDALEYLNNFSEGDPASRPDDALGPLRKAIGKVAALKEAVTKGVQEPDEEGLRDLARKLGAVKKEIMAMNRSLVVGQSASLATEAHELASEAGEAIRASRETIKAALQGMGAASDISEASGPTGVPRPPPARPAWGGRVGGGGSWRES